MKEKRKFNDTLLQKTLVEIAGELGCLVTTDKPILKWRKSTRDKFLNELKSRAETYLSAKERQYDEDPTAISYDEVTNALLTVRSLYSIESIILTRESDKLANATMVAACVNLVIALGSIIFTVLRATGAV